MSIENQVTAGPRPAEAFNSGNPGGVKPLTTADTEWAAKVLEQAFYKDELLNYIYGDTIHKPGKLNWFFRTTFRLAALYGDCLGTAEQDGALMMFAPGQTDMSLGKVFRSGLYAAPFKLGWAPLSRMMKFMDFAEKEHKAAISADHYYIMTVGVLPERQGKGVGKKLMTRALEIVDAKKVACFLETQNEHNVPIYQKLGFDVVSDKEMPGGGLHNWGMLRDRR